MDVLLNSFAQARPNGTGDVINDLARTPLSQVVICIAVLTVLRMAIYKFLRDTPPHQRMGLYPVLRGANELMDALVYAGAFVFLLVRPYAVQTFRIPSGSMWPTLYVNDFIVANKAVYRYSEPQFGDIVVFRPPVEATQGHPEQVDENNEVKVDFIKRLIGLPGDVIEVKDGVLYRNGKAVADKYKHFSDCTRVDGGVCQDFRLLSEDELNRMTKTSFKFVKYKGEVIPLNYTAYDTNAAAGQGNFGEINAPYSVAGKFEITDPAIAQELVRQPPQPIPSGYFFFMGDNRNNSFDSRGWGLVPRASIVGRSELIWLPFTRLGQTR